MTKNIANYRRDTQQYVESLPLLLHLPVCELNSEDSYTLRLISPVGRSIEVQYKIVDYPEYRTTENWIYTAKLTLESNTFDVVVPTGKFIQFQSTNATGLRFASIFEECRWEAWGDVRSLFGWSDMLTQASDGSNMVCYAMFISFTTLYLPPVIGFTDVYNYLTARECPGAFVEMFADCANLQEVPALHLTYYSSFCCQAMFQGCTSIQDARDFVPSGRIRQVNEAAFIGTFRGCKKLKYGCQFNDYSFDSGLPPVVCGESAFSNMYAYCKNLEEADIIEDAYFGGYCCATMFSNCSNLKRLTNLFITCHTVGFAAFTSTFINCSALKKLPYMTIQGPVDGWAFDNMCASSGLRQSVRFEWLLDTAPEDTDNAFAYMYYNCSNLRVIYHPFNLWNTRAHYGWVEGVGTTGIYISDHIIPEIYDLSHIPEGWVLQYRHEDEQPSIYEGQKGIRINDKYIPNIFSSWRKPKVGLKGIALINPNNSSDGRGYFISDSDHVEENI